VPHRSEPWCDKICPRITVTYHCQTGEVKVKLSGSKLQSIRTADRLRRRFSRLFRPQDDQTFPCSSHSQVKNALQKKILGGLLAVGVTLITVFAFVWYSRGISGNEYRVFTSPNDRFRVVVYRSRQWLAPMPGQSGDARGTVCLFDVRTGKLLHRKRVEMVQLIDEVTWSPTNVSIKLFADWDLP
jgi:hypothetical protein